MDVTKIVVGTAVTLSGLAVAWCAVAAPMGELIRTVDHWSRTAFDEHLSSEPVPVGASKASLAHVANPDDSNVAATRRATPAARSAKADRGPRRVARLRNDDRKRARDTRSRKGKRRRPKRRERDSNDSHRTATPKEPPTPRVVVLDRNAPACDKVYVYIVSDWVDGGAMATIAHGRKSEGRLVRVGSRFAGYQVVDIGMRGNGLGPAVWLMKRDQLCQARLFADNPTRARHRKARRRSKKRRRRR